jgi:hypothetical protein
MDLFDNPKSQSPRQNYGGQANNKQYSKSKLQCPKQVISAKSGHEVKLSGYPLNPVYSGCRIRHPGLDPGPA